MQPVNDLKERQQALDPEQSFIVQAPAGSGKTELLIQRFLKLLGHVQYPEQILAMTFTRKAAGEMKSRILKALEKAQKSQPPEKDHEKQTWELAGKVLEQDKKNAWRLLENPTRLKIQTIDSFCATLTGQMPILSQLGGSLTIQENAEEIYRETAYRILRRVEDDQPVGEYVRQILRHLDNSKDTFVKRIRYLLQKRDQWMIPFFDRLDVTDKTRRYLEEVLARLIEAILREAHALFPAESVEKIIPLAAYSGANLAARDPSSPGACLGEISKFPEPEIECLEQWRALANLFLTGDGKLRKKVDVNTGFPANKTSEGKQMKQDFIQLLQSLDGMQEFQEILHEVQLLPTPRYTEGEWNVLQATILLLPEISATLRQVFIELGTTDFTEISLSAGKALGSEDNPTDLLLYLDNKIQHILVDEFQDTSFKQDGLLKKLTYGWEPGDGRTLFIVGDPMQSIYRFRDAEVGLFLQTREKGVGAVQLESLTLKTNFRSQKKVVDWVNECFSTVFPAEDDQDLGAIAYAKSSAHLPADSEEGTVLHPITNAEEEADEIARLVQSIHQNHPGQSIALLVRARTHLPEIIKRFKEREIEFKADEIDSLTERPAILDLLALLRALLSPLDRVSWLSILRAPWCGLSLNDLHSLCFDEADVPIWNLLNDENRIAGLSADGQIRARKFTAVMENVLPALPSAAFRDLLEGCWIQLGGPACVDENTPQDVQVFFDEVSSVIESGNTFSLENFHIALENLYASPAVGKEDAVQIMTMHKAKGLEFDFVILPGLGKQPRIEDKRLAFWMPHGGDLLIAPIAGKEDPESKIYNFISRLDKEKDRFEIFRLLYVASTRAKKQLHLFGQIKNKDDQTSLPAGNSLLGKLWPHLEEEWLKKLDQGENEPEPILTDETKPIHRTWRLPSGFQFPPPHPDIDTGAVAELIEEEEYPEFVWAGNEVRCLGNVLHRCFKDIADEGVENWSNERMNGFAPKLQTALMGEGLSPAKVEAISQEGVKALRNILEDKTGRWILGNHEQAHSEYPLTAQRENRIIDRIIDRTFVDNGVRWIIDYKTGKHEGANLEKFFNEEKERYRGQLMQYEELLRMQGETQPIKKALYYPLHQRLIEL